MGKTHTPYTKAEKDAVLARLLSPAPEPVAVVSKETGISIPTLKKWMRDAQSETPNDEGGGGAKLSMERKFQVVLETATLDEYALGEYAREHGLYVKDIKEWAQNARLSNSPGACTLTKYKEAEAKKKEAEKEIETLKQELANAKKDIDEKVKVIAEQAAIIILQKKTFHLNS